MRTIMLALSSAALAALMATPGLAQEQIDLWFNNAGNPAETSVVERIVNDFNASQSDYEVVAQAFPQSTYNETIVAAALAGNLPDILAVDGPIMPNWAWSGYLVPLDIDEGKIASFLPGTKGHWDGELYAIGLWDAAVAMFARRSTLERFDIRIPTLAEPWSLEEFDAALETIKASGEYEYPVDLGLAIQGEWYPYALSPFLQSFGGDIVDRSTYLTAEDALNGEAALEFGEWWQSLFTRGLAPGPSQDPADRETGFLEGKYALSWNGSWKALGAIAEFGDDIMFLPAPDFGQGPTIGAASWQYAVTSNSKHPEGAMAFVEFMLKDDYVAAFSEGIGLIPATRTAAAMTENYAEDGPMNVFFGLSEAQAKLRPVTPGYLVAGKVFREALANIANGADVADTLDAAVDSIDADIKRNQGYGH